MVDVKNFCLEQIHAPFDIEEFQQQIREAGLTEMSPISVAAGFLGIADAEDTSLQRIRQLIRKLV